DKTVITESAFIKGRQDGANFIGRDLKDVTISFDYVQGSNVADIKFVINGIEPSSGDDPLPSDEITNNFISGTLPVLYINVYNEAGQLDNEIISKDLAHKNYFKGEYWLDTNNCEWMKAMGAKSIGSKDEPLPLEIKARGNYTRKGFSKKPFKLKLGSKQAMLGLSKSKHFAILAHADDNYGYLRNFTGFNLGRRIGLPWTPDQQPVEVVINGDYRGLYFLTESIRIEADRINITELEDNVSDPVLASGGYLIELDNYEEENQIRMAEKGQAGGFKDELRITFDTPEIYSDLQRKFVENQFVAMNDAIGDNSDNLWAYMDMDDAARYYIVEEMISHTEAYHGSTYMFRDRGADQKWHFSPLWDCGNGFNGPTNDYFTNASPFGNTWIASMRMNNKFMDKVRETWKWFMSSKFNGLYAEIDQYAQRLKSAAESDYKRWNNQPIPDGGQSVVDNRNMENRSELVKNHLSTKINWLKSQFGDYENSLYAEPARDITPAAPLPPFVESGDDPIHSDVITNNFISGTLPVLYINVYNEFGQLDNEIISMDLAHKNYFSGEYWLDANDCEWMKAMGAESIGSKESPLPLEIKARGNYTRKGFSKKPFKLKLGKKQSMLGLSKSKHFAILAHADDNYGYLRNFTGFNLGRRIGLPWTPDQQPVEVVINGDYRGLYFLTESIRVEADRINITELEDNVSDPALASGGYLVELDNYEEDNQIRMAEKGQAGGYKDELRITFDTPEVYSDLQRNFVESQFVAMNDAIGDNSDDLWAYMDMDDAARYYIVEEMISHTESYHGSTYMFRDRGADQKWHFSPLWDCGNGFNGPTNDYFTSASPFGNTWIASMRMNNKFMDKVKETWKWFMSSKFNGLYDEIDNYCERLKSAAEADYKRWHDQPFPYAGQPVVDNRDMNHRRDRVKDHLSNKINWMKSQFGEFDNSFVAEPQLADTPAAPLHSFIISGIEGVNAIYNDDSKVEIFTLDGIKVTNPEIGKIYIIVREGKAEKCLTK
ncbi:MAG: CotH kinase family protein, partial [Muribaculaceae bacterium]|nr:CotH kinase family protein [Muribaculaceae bacterium]